MKVRLYAANAGVAWELVDHEIERHLYSWDANTLGVQLTSKNRSGSEFGDDEGRVMDNQGELDQAWTLMSEEDKARVLGRYDLLPVIENICFICGRTDSDNYEEGWGPCVDVAVLMAYEEEGFSHVKKYVCNDHLIEMVDRFKALGFVSHHHGSTTLLEDDTCPGYNDYGACPTPKGYGEGDPDE